MWSVPQRVAGNYRESRRSPTFLPLQGRRVSKEVLPPETATTDMDITYRGRLAMGKRVVAGSMVATREHRLATVSLAQCKTGLCSENAKYPSSAGTVRIMSSEAHKVAGRMAI